MGILKTENCKLKTDPGFTLIELLIVIAIIGFLAAAVLVAVDPIKRIQDSRDARRYSEVNALLNAVLNKQVDDQKIFNADPAALIRDQSGSNVQVIVSDTAGINCNDATARPACSKSMDTGFGSGTRCVARLLETATSSSLVPNYFASIPVDPRGAGTASICPNTCTTPGWTYGDTPFGAKNSGYYIARTAGSNRIEVGSCFPEQAATISMKR